MSNNVHAINCFSNVLLSGNKLDFIAVNKGFFCLKKFKTFMNVYFSYNLLAYLLTYLYTDGTPCPPMRMLIEKERCADIPCHTYYWTRGAARRHTTARVTHTVSLSHVLLGARTVAAVSTQLSGLRTSSSHLSGRRISPEMT